MNNEMWDAIFDMASDEDSAEEEVDEAPLHPLCKWCAEVESVQCCIQCNTMLCDICTEKVAAPPRARITLRVCAPPVTRREFAHPATAPGAATHPHAAPVDRRSST